MKAKLTKLTLTAILGIAATTSAFAVDKNEVSTHFSDQAPSAQSQAARQSAPLGYKANGDPDRVINIDSSTKYINVEQAETVQINSGGKVLTWTFDTFGTPTFSLSKIFSGVDGVTVYVSGNSDDFS